MKEDGFSVHGNGSELNTVKTSPEHTINSISIPYFPKFFSLSFYRLCIPTPFGRTIIMAYLTLQICGFTMSCVALIARKMMKIIQNKTKQLNPIKVKIAWITNFLE